MEVHFCRTFMANHFNYFSSLPGFPIMELLSMLFKFTFCQSDPEALNACLEIWDDFLDQLAVLEESTVQTAKPSIEYESLLVSLFNESLKKAQFEHSRNELYLRYVTHLCRKC